MMKLIETVELTDANLVADSLKGNREAFGYIVAKYQTLICSLVYSSTGNLTQSEDLAQDTFVAAWKQLPSLREPHKLRSWLCGIARNLTCDALKKQGREPSHAAETLDDVHELAESSPLARDFTISSEEQAILWRAVEQIPEIYRAPLVLFYREHQSIEAVAQSLELSEDAVKQRLSRGRKLLHEQVLTFIEGALAKTSPGKTFTLGVLAALPMTATTAKAATVGTAIAKGGAAMKGASGMGLLLGVLPLLCGMYVSSKAQADDAKSPRERQFMFQMIRIRFVIVLLTLLAFVGLKRFDFFHQPFTQDILRGGFVFVCLVVGTGFFAYTSRRQREIQIGEGTYVEAEWILPRKETDSLDKLSGDKPKKSDWLYAIRVMAMGLVMVVVMVAQSPWTQHVDQAILWSAAMMLALFLSYREWQNRPRYQSPRASWLMCVMTLFGLFTLGLFNLHQYQALSGPVGPNAISPALVITYNLIVLGAYATFIGILALNRKNADSRTRYATR